MGVLWGIPFDRKEACALRVEVDRRMEWLSKMIKLLQYVGAYATVLSVLLEAIHCLLVHLGF